MDEMSKKLWIYRECDDEAVRLLASEAGISKLLATVFVSRGITDSSYVKGFLEPKLDRLYSPFLLKDMDKAVQRISGAIDNKEQILIYGDYDVDGVTSTSILYDFLKRLGAKTDYYIPDRFEDGYGLSDGTVDDIIKTGAQLLITVDCGITAVNEIRRLNENGITVIVTDHHECIEVLPDAYAVINPHRPDCRYPFKELAGVGVVFKLLHGLCQYLNIGDRYLDYLDLVTLGTVADVVQLTDENRIIVKFGLEAIEKTKNVGLEALINVAGLKGKAVNTYGVGFALAPRINAAGRIGSAIRAVKLFTTTDPAVAEEIAAELNEANKYRQETEAEILQQAVNYVEQHVDLENEKVIIATGKGWHHGIIGIVASKITEKYYRPCILISEEDGMARGSGRSIEGFNIFKALSHCEELLVKFGGHELAAGLSLEATKLMEFRRLINAYAEEAMTPDILVPRIKIDSRLDAEDLDISSVEELELLAPYGPGNPCPVFSLEGLKIREIRTVGDGRHLKLKLEEGKCVIDAIAFNMGEQSENFAVSDFADTVFTLEVNSWNNTRKVQLVLKDIRHHKAIVFSGLKEYNINIGAPEAASSMRPEEFIPERNDLKAVYQHIRSNLSRDMRKDGTPTFNTGDLSRLSMVISDRYRVVMNRFKLLNCLEIFEELKLIKMEADGERGLDIVLCGDGKEKVSLESSPLYRKLQQMKGNLPVAGSGTAG